MSHNPQFGFYNIGDCANAIVSCTVPPIIMDRILENGRRVVKLKTEPWPANLVSASARYMVVYMVDIGQQGMFTIGPYSQAELAAGVYVEPEFYDGIRHQYRVYNAHFSCGKDAYHYTFIEPAPTYPVTLYGRISLWCEDLNPTPTDGTTPPPAPPPVQVLSLFVERESEKIKLESDSNDIVGIKIYNDRGLTSEFVGNPALAGYTGVSNRPTSLFTMNPSGGGVLAKNPCLPQFPVTLVRWASIKCNETVSDRVTLYVSNADEQRRINTNTSIGGIVLYTTRDRTTRASVDPNKPFYEPPVPGVRNTMENGVFVTTSGCVDCDTGFVVTREVVRDGGPNDGANWIRMRMTRAATGGESFWTHRYIVERMVDIGQNGIIRVGEYTKAEIEAGIWLEPDFYDNRHQYRLYSNNPNCGSSTYSYHFLDPLPSFNLTVKQYANSYCDEPIVNEFNLWTRTQAERDRINNDGDLNGITLFMERGLFNAFSSASNWFYSRPGGARRFLVSNNGLTYGSTDCLPRPSPTPSVSVTPTPTPSRTVNCAITIRVTPDV